MIYYSKVKFKFQHCQEVNDCFLELFQSYLYFQSAGPNGLTYQGLLPLKELQVRELEAGQSPGQQDHALHISGPLLNPLVVFCPSEAELKQWLYHLEKQIQLCGGSLALPLLSQSGWKQSPGGKEELRWSVQNLPVQDWRGTQRESLGEILCISKVKLQHLPFQEQHDRLLVLYPSTLVIMSEEPSGLCFKGELPLNAIQVLFEENNKTSFLIEGRLINSIRVTCPSYQDYQEWLYCLKTAQFRNADSSLSGSESFSGSKPPHPSQCLAQPSWPSTALPTQDLRRGNSARKSKGKSSGQQLPNQDPERSGCGLIPANPNGELQSPVYHEPYAAHCPQQHPPAHLELGRFLQCHGQTGPAQGNPAVPAPQHPSLEHWNCREVPTAPTYSTPGTSRRLQLRALAQGSYLGEVRLQTPLWAAGEHSGASGGHSGGAGEQPGVPVCLGGPCRALSPLVSARGRPGGAGMGLTPCWAASQDGTAHPPSLSRSLPCQRSGWALRCTPQVRPLSCWAAPCPPRPSELIPSSLLLPRLCHLPCAWAHLACLPLPPRGAPAVLQARSPCSAQPCAVILLPPDPFFLFPLRFPADGSGGTYGLADATCPCRDSSSYHDYAELQSFQSDLSYDNLWEAEEKELGTPCSSPSPAQQIYQV
uniref:Pleckstrin homology domain containing N1 n=1 Tax=Corvus moneduloides TaxID=1196302 RepID=A0A8C3DYX4_CORMO